MMRRDAAIDPWARRTVRLAAAIVLCLISIPAARGDSSGAGYFFLPTPPLGFTLMAAPIDAAPGTIRRSVSVGALPECFAAGEWGIAMIYRSSAQESRQRTWPVREVRGTAPGAAATVDPLPPLVLDGAPLDVCVTHRGTNVLVEEDGRRALLELRGARWEAIDPPPEFRPERAAQLLSVAGEAAVYQEDDEGAHLWIRTTRAGGQYWSPTRFPAVGGAILHEVGGQIIGVRRSRNAVEFSLVRPSGVRVVKRVDGLAGDHWVVAGGRAIMLVESDGALLPRLTCRVLSPTGSMLYEGPAIMVSAIGARDIAFLLLALVSLAAAVTVFVFRPEASRRQSVLIPEGTALAGPVTRGMAGVLDFSFAWLIAGIILGSMGSGISGSMLPSGEGAPITLLLALPIAVVIGAAGEFFWGRSPGKMLTGCRVASASGQRLTLGQAIARNLVRFLCPPMGMAWMLQGPEHGPGLFGTVVVIDIADQQQGPSGSQ